MQSWNESIDMQQSAILSAVSPDQDIWSGSWTGACKHLFSSQIHVFAEPRKTVSAMMTSAEYLIQTV